MVNELLWDDPVMATDGASGNSTEVDTLLTAAHSAATTLFILSAGFDPRCTAALERFINVVGDVPHVLAIDPQPPHMGSGPELTNRRGENLAKLMKLATRSFEQLAYPQVHDESSVGRLISQAIVTSRRLSNIQSVVFDISSIPTSIAFTPLLALLESSGKSGFPSELQVLVTENSELDGAITEGGLGPAHLLPGFGKRGQKTGGLPPVEVWTPVLGVGAGPAMRKIADRLNPQEVCPVVPFPARDPRLVDRLMLEHRQFLVEENRVQPTSFIYAAETNPFDLYRNLVRFERDYQSTFALLGGARVYVSAHGSKLLSVGALLAAYECNMPFYAVRASTHSLSDEHWQAELRAFDRLACLWLRGAPYSM